MKLLAYKNIVLVFWLMLYMKKRDKKKMPTQQL